MHPQTNTAGIESRLFPVKSGSRSATTQPDHGGRP